MHMSECSNCIPPERARELGFIEHADNRLHECPVCTLSNTILVWFSSDSVLSLDSMSSTERLPFTRHVFPSFIIAQSLDRAAQLVLSKCLELLERCKCTRLVLEWQNSPVTRKIVNEGDPVLVVVSGLHWEWAMDV